MTKKRKDSSYHQLSLFDFIKETVEGDSKPKGGLDIKNEVKMALSDDLRYATDEHGKELSRAQVSARMTDEIGFEITLSQLNNWTATSHPHEMPLSYLPAFIRATGGQRRAVDVLSKYSGLFILPGPEAIRAEIRKRDEIVEKTKAEKREWVMLLKKVEGK